MLVYRVCSAAYPNLDGEGARLYGGRWNSPGLAIVYTASSLSLAILETRVHLRRLPVDYVRLVIEIPDSHFHPTELAAEGFDANWRLDSTLTRWIGDTHFAGTPLVPLRVPSVAVDGEWNILFSKDFAAMHASILDARPVTMDPRLWSV
jgi:RES domain-containing protein